MAISRDLQISSGVEDIGEQKEGGDVWGIELAATDTVSSDAVDSWYEACGCGGCCFPADSSVLMADGRRKAIQDVRVGDSVWGATGVNTVYEIVTPILGPRKMLQMADGSLRWSEEHALWTMRDGEQWWGAQNKLEWEREVSIGILGGLNHSESIRQLSRESETYAHEDGWKTLDVVEVPADPRTRLYYLRTDRCHTVIIDGFVVSGGVNDADFDYKAMNWEGLASLRKAVEATARIVENVNLLTETD